MPSRRRPRRGPALHSATLRPEESSTSSTEGSEAAGLWQAVAVTAVVSSATANVGAARADTGDWKPRRHHRHMGERYTANWAAAVVQVGALTAWHALASACLLINDASEWMCARTQHGPSNRSQCFAQGEEQDREMIKQLQKQLQQEKKRATVRCMRVAVRLCCSEHGPLCL